MAKTLLITGAGGFLGATLVRHFLDEYDVHILVRKSTDLSRIKDLLSRVTTHYADITSYDETLAAVTAARPQYIIHAAVYGMYASEKDEGLMTRTIIDGTMNLVRACKQQSFTCFINTGTCSEYGAKSVKMREDLLPEPNRLYGVLKVATTLYCQHIAREEKQPIVTLRLFNVYGYDELPWRLVPSVVNAYLDGTAPKLSSPHNVRDYVFIDDVARAYALVLQHPETAGEVFNVCSGKETKTSDVVRATQRLLRTTLAPAYGQDAGRPFDATKWRGDFQKLKRATGWAPQHTLTQGIRKMIAWERRRRSERNA